MFDFKRRRLVPTRQVLEDLVEWTAPARKLLGVDVEIPERNGAQRSLAALAEGQSIEQIYRNSVRETRETYAPSPAPVGDD
jgi:hypothetical protein